MNEESKKSPPAIPPSETGEHWTTYFAVALVTTGMAVLSFFFAILSINQTVINISIWTSIACLVASLALTSPGRVGYAFLLAIANIPIFFAIAALFEYGLSLEKDIAAKMTTIESAIDSKFGLSATLDKAVQAGSLRRASQEDIKAFKDAYFENIYTKNKLAVPETADASIVSKVDTSRAYVVLKEFTFPSGTTRKNSAVFYLPKGVPMPSGELGFSAIFDFSTLTVSCTVFRTGTGSC